MDDILIYSNTLDEHHAHVRQVLDRLRQFGLQVDISKCEFDANEVKYLGLIINTGGVRMDPAKVAAVTEWPVPRSVNNVQTFLGFANFYRRFILEYSRIIRPLTSLTRKDQKFDWTPECQSAFDLLKFRFD